jgi:hypothetical protein
MELRTVYAYPCLDERYARAGWLCVSFVQKSEVVIESVIDSGYHISLESLQWSSDLRSPI